MRSELPEQTGGHQTGQRFIDRGVLITGGTSGIGRETVRLFIAAGARVAFTGRRVSLGQEVARSTGAVYIPADHGIRADCERCVTEAQTALGRIDVLFNNAGIVTRGTAESTTDEVWESTFRVNVTGLWWMSRAVLPLMRAQGGGVIVNNASDWGLIGGRDAAAYCAAKGAVVQLTRAMALDHARENIRINAVCPGDTYVDRWAERGDFDGPESREEVLRRYGEALPLGRVGQAEEVARVVLFLASDASSFMTGQTVAVDGGNTAGGYGLCSQT
jgi:NAD(P)-dependent dehydrogenase (short-subunit alcohol dehydrogenase family)